jgi:hypothetical protein
MVISKPPTNEFEASANLQRNLALRAARVSGPLKRDKVMGAFAFAGASGTATSATSSIRTIRLAATMSPRYAASCTWSSIAARICCCRATPIARAGFH